MDRSSFNDSVGQLEDDISVDKMWQLVRVCIVGRYRDGSVGVVGGAAVRVAGGGAAPAMGRRTAQPMRSPPKGLAHALLASGRQVLHYIQGE